MQTRKNYPRAVTPGLLTANYRFVSIVIKTKNSITMKFSDFLTLISNYKIKFYNKEITSTIGIGGI